MKKRIFFFLLLFLFNRLNAQYENVWVFGDFAGLDFNNGTPVSIKTNIQGGNCEGNASVCDENGQLLFYTEGSFVWNKDHALMPNGENLPGLPDNVLGQSLTSSSTQGAIIVPHPGEPSLYYVFSIISIESSYYGRLYYSVIDMRLNGGLGDVIAEKKGILLDSHLTEKMTGVVGDRCNIWLLVHVRNKNVFHAWEITSTGITSQPVVSEAGNFMYYDVGMLKCSQDRKKLLACNVFENRNGLELYDFNPLTGQVANARILDNEQMYTGVFSPDNSKVYAISYRGAYLYQFDLSHTDPASTKTTINKIRFSDLKLGPDNRIYCNSNSRTTGGRAYSRISRINFPNRQGQACNFEVDVVELLPGTSSPGNFSHIVPVIQRDTFLSGQIAGAPCFGNVNPLTLHASDDSTGWDYVWHDGSYGPERKADTPGSYWITYHTPPCNYHTDTFHVIFPNGVLPDITVSASCKNEKNGKAYAYTYVGDTVKYHYIWRNNNNDILSSTDVLGNVPSGNYTLQVTTADCDTTLSFFIPEEDYKVSFQADSIICQGDEVTFRNTSDVHFSVFHWDFGDNSNSREQNPLHSYESTGNYEVTLVGIGETCTDTAYQTIAVDPRLEAHFAKDRDSICQGESITLTQEMGNASTNLHWQMGDGNDFSAFDREASHAYDRPGIMHISLTAQFRACPASSFTDTVYVHALPKVDLGADRGLCLSGAPIVLRNLYAGHGLQRYLWNTGDTTESLRATHPGIYRLTVSEAPLGCSNSESIEIKKDCYIDIPNAFTPDGDGENDYFFPKQLLSGNVTSFKMQVFNRWGQLVFETSNVNGRGWDGRFNGKEQPQAVYIYRIEVGLDNSRNEKYEGNVTLLR